MGFFCQQPSLDWNCCGHHFSLILLGLTYTRFGLSKYLLHNLHACFCAFLLVLGALCLRDLVIPSLQGLPHPWDWWSPLTRLAPPFSWWFRGAPRGCTVICKIYYVMAIQIIISFPFSFPVFPIGNFWVSPLFFGFLAPFWELFSDPHMRWKMYFLQTESWLWALKECLFQYNIDM